MWLLVFLCISTVGCVPLNIPRDTTGDAQVGAAILNATHNVTTPTSDGGVTLNDTERGDWGECPPPKCHLRPSGPLNDTVTASDGGVPLNDTVTTSGSYVPLNDTGNATSQDEGDGFPLNYTGNATSQDAVPQIPVQQQDNAETLEELEDDMVVEEGDMLMPEDRNAVQSIWPNGVVPFAISDELAYQRENIYAALKMISDITCIRFIPHTTQYDYINFVSGKGCASFVGFQGGAQKLFYGQSCSVGNVCHEVIHALGIQHEHTRADRDQYVSVAWEKIREGKSKNFKVKHGDTLNLPYDLDSIMHYGTHFFSVDGSPTVLTKQSGVHIGQRKYLSQLDIQRLNRLYHCW